MTATSETRPTSEFLARAGHELRTPLNAILGMLELSLAEPLPTTLRDYLTTARDSARTLTVSLDDVLDLAQADAGELMFDNDPIQLEAVAAEAIQPLEQRARNLQRQIVLRVSPRLPHDVWGDARRLKQILVRLAEHAIKRLDGPRLVVEVAENSRSKNTLKLQLGVSEFGVGTPVDRNGFVPFDPASFSKYSAAGLGLTLADCWLRIMRGRLWTASNPESDGGLYATFELSRSPTSHARDRTRPVNLDYVADASSDFRSTWAGRPLTVLVADDTQANQKVVKAVLTRRGHHVELADNGRQAVERVTQRTYDVVLMDAQMPTMNGLQAAEAIRHLPNDEHARVPIIAMTAHAMQEDRQRCLAAGMDDYLSKPLDVAALIARVEYYGGRPAEPSPATSAPTGSARTSMDDRQEFVSGALARLGGDEELLLELIRLFRQDAHLLVRKLYAGLEVGDAEAVARAAHNLRGLAANFDAAATVEFALEIERSATRGELSTAAKRVPEFEIKLDNLLASLDRYERNAAR
jgi:CheY-like chemotaxis protein/HPt (histidine-containing phosphotransfer) domain-containing protein